MSKKRRTQSRSTSGGTVPKAVGPGKSGSRVRMWACRAGISLYVIWLLVIPPGGLDTAIRVSWHKPRSWILEHIRDAFAALGFEDYSRFVLQGAFYVLLALVVPLVGSHLIGRGRPFDNGWRKPNRFMLRIVGGSFLFSVPFIFWMVQSPEFAPYYRRHFEEGVLTVLTYLVVVLFCEHFFFEGIMLAAFRADGRWPEPAKIVEDAPPGWRRVAQWFGVGYPTGSARGFERVTRWLGIPDGCVGAILLSGILFGLMHSGKAGRELFLAFPGGIALAALAYRCNSWHAPYLLHAGNVTVSGVLLVLLQK